MRGLNQWKQVFGGILFLISLGFFFPGGAFSQGQPVFAVNSGGGQYTGKAGGVYQADGKYSGGSTYKVYVGINGTEDDLLYQSERYGNFSYNIPVTLGTYNVTLKFAEIYYGVTKAGQRVFNVKIEGQEVLSKFDILAQVGPYTALDKTFQVNVTDGVLNVEFRSLVNNAKVNAILVTPASSGPVQYTIAATAGAGGAIQPSGAVNVPSGGTQTFSIASGTGYRILDVKVDGQSKGATHTLTIANVTANHTVEAAFILQGDPPAPGKPVFAVNSGGGQYTNKSGVVYQTDGKYSGGSTYKVYVGINGTEDDVLYQTERWGDFSYNIGVTPGAYDVTLKFAEIYYGITRAGQRVFNVKIEGQEVLSKFDVFAQTGPYTALDKTFRMNVTDGALNIEFRSVVGSAKVNAILVTPASSAPVQYTITATAGAGGTIQPSGAVTVPSGGTQTFKMTPNSGYRILDVKVDGQSKGATNIITLANVTANHTVEAAFAVIPAPLVITATAGAGGTISPSGQATVAYGGQQTFAITPNSGYLIDQVMVDGVSKGAISSYTFANVMTPHTITASFKPAPVLIGCPSGGIPTEYYDELCTPRALPVLVINYMPVGTSVGSTAVLRGPENDAYTGNAVIHCEETGIPDGCGRSGARMLARDRLPALKNSANLVADFLTEATRFHAYQDPSAPPALTFQIVDTVTILQKQDHPNDPLWPNTLGYPRGNPLGNNEYRDPFRYIFETAEICQYVKDHGVRLVFYNTYFFHGSVPAESFSAGPLGNVGNSEGSLTNYIAYCRNGAPVSTPQEADVTYHAISYGPTNGTFPPGNSIEDFTHHLEALFRRADYDLWENRFVGPGGHQDRAYMGWWMPGLLPGQYFSDGKVLNTWGLKIWVDALNVPGDRSARLHIEPVPGVNPPDRNWPPGDTTPNVQMNLPFTISSESTVALEGKDIKINYWENGGRAFFNVYRPSADYAVVRRCGWTHYPPNGEGDYNWGNAYWRVRTDCEDWAPDQSGEILADVDCRTWTGVSSGKICPQDPFGTNMGAELGFKKWWMQNIPGLDNRILWNESGQTRQVRNFWYYLSDYHRAIQKNAKLSFGIQRIETSAPTGLNVARSGNGISLIWAAPLSGVDGYNVFRAVSSNGPFYRVNNELVTTETFFDDFVLTQGKTYYYDVRSFKRVQSETGAKGSITFQ